MTIYLIVIVFLASQLSALIQGLSVYQVIVGDITIAWALALLEKMGANC